MSKPSISDREYISAFGAWARRLLTDLSARTSTLSNFARWCYASYPYYQQHYRTSQELYSFLSKWLRSDSLRFPLPCSPDASREEVTATLLDFGPAALGALARINQRRIYSQLGITQIPGERVKADGPDTAFRELARVQTALGNVADKATEAADPHSPGGEEWTEDECARLHNSLDDAEIELSRLRDVVRQLDAQAYRRTHQMTLPGMGRDYREEATA
jgi:hypothetical protein